MSSPTLDDRIQALPRELQDAILEAWITIDSTTEITITESYKPPSQLHVSRSIRTSFATAYYAHTTFILHTYNFEMNIPWLSSLSSEHRDLIQHLRWECDHSDMSDWIKQDLKRMSARR